MSDRRFLFPVLGLSNTVCFGKQCSRGSVLNILSGIGYHRRLTPTSPQPAPRGAPGVIESPARCGGGGGRRHRALGCSEALASRASGRGPPVGVSVANASNAVRPP